MNDLRFTDTNAADDSTGRAFGLDGNLYLPVAVAALGSVGLFAELTFWLHTNWVVAGAVAAVPLALTAGWALGLKHGRPAGHDPGPDYGPGGAGLDTTPAAFLLASPSGAARASRTVGQ